MSKIDFTPRPEELSDPETDPPLTEIDIARGKLCDEMRRIMTEYLQPDSDMSLDEAINGIAPLYHDRDGKVNNFHVTVIDLANKIPYGHSSHRKLAELVTAFSSSNKWLTQSRWQTRPQAVANFWGELNIYLYDEAMMSPDQWAKETGDAMFYANMHAFLAGYAADGEIFPHFWARVALESALEDGQSDSSPRSRDASVIGAAQYILRNAQDIYVESLKTRKPDHESMSQKLISCFRRFKSQAKERQPDFTWDRWHTWKTGFKAVAANDMYGRTCRDIAESAADEMILQEKSHKKLLSP